MTFQFYDQIIFIIIFDSLPYIYYTVHDPKVSHISFCFIIGPKIVPFVTLSQIFLFEKSVTLWGHALYITIYLPYILVCVFPVHKNISTISQIYIYIYITLHCMYDRLLSMLYGKNKSHNQKTE